VRKLDWRFIGGNAAAAAVLAVVAAGGFDLPALLSAFAAPLAPTGAAFAIAGQLRWAAGTIAAFLFLRAFGVFRLFPRRRFAAALARGSPAAWGAAVFALALVLRLVYAVFAAAPPVSDEGCYAALADAVAAGRGLVGDDGPTAYWPVGYVAFLAGSFRAFGSSFIPVIIAQALLGAGTAALVVPLGERFVGQAGARAGGLLLALWPSQVAYAARVFPAVASAFLIVAAAYFILIRSGYGAGAAAGLLAGLATLVLPAAALLPVALGVADWLASRRPGRALGRAAVAAAVAAAVVAPWTWRNWRAFGAFIPVSTNGGVNLWMGNNPHANGSYYYPTSRKNPLFMTEGELARDRVGKELAWYFIRTQRERVALLLVPKFAYLFGADISAFQLEDVARGGTTAAGARGVPARVAQTYYALACLGFILTLVAARRRIFREAGGLAAPAALLIVPAYLTLVYLAFFGQDRFHAPMLPFVAILAGAALAGGAAPPERKPGG